MSISKIYGLYGVRVHTSGGDDTLIGGVSEHSFGAGITVTGEPKDGAVHPEFNSVTAGSPTASFTTHAVATGLGLVPPDGLKLDPSGAVGLVLYLEQHDQGGTRAAAASHRALTIANGVLLPRSLSIPHQGQASMSFEAMATSADGAAAAATLAEGVTLPARPADNQRFTIHSVSVGGVALTGVRNVEVDFGVSAVREAADSDVYPTFVSVRQAAPQINIDGIDPEWFRTTSGVPLIGLNATHAGTEIVLRKRAKGGTFVADSVAEHIRIRSAGVVTVDESFAASGADAAGTSVSIATRKDDSNVPLLIETGYQISGA